MGMNPSLETPKKIKKNWLSHNITLMGVRMGAAAIASWVCVAKQGFLRDIRFYTTKFSMWLCNRKDAKVRARGANTDLG